MSSSIPSIVFINIIATKLSTLNMPSYNRLLSQFVFLELEIPQPKWHQYLFVVCLICSARLTTKKKFTWDRAAIQWWYLTSHYISGFCVLLSTTVGWNFIWRSIGISEKYSYFNYILMIEYRKVTSSRLVYYSILETFGLEILSWSDKE